MTVLLVVLGLCGAALMTWVVVRLSGPRPQRRYTRLGGSPPAWGGGFNHYNTQIWVEPSAGDYRGDADCGCAEAGGDCGGDSGGCDCGGGGD